jgi:hypothetical protein
MAAPLNPSVLQEGANEFLTLCLVSVVGPAHAYS